MECGYYEAGRCRSCTLLPTAYDAQVRAQQDRVRRLLPPMPWLPAVTSADSGFRNKAKLVVGGSMEQPTLGIIGQDLRECGLHEPVIVAALPVLAEFVTRASLQPYDIAARRVELKHLIVTSSPDEELMVRFVSRSQEPVTRIRKHLPWLLAQLPVRVASVNLQPVHKAVLEGDREIVLSQEDTLPMRINDLTLQLRPQSFFQTNTGVAAELYRIAQTWAGQIAPHTVWDLYCGVGGFARHLAGPGRDVTGVEISAEAVAAANLDQSPGLRFEVGDADAWVAGAVTPDLVVVNPPRRGIGRLAETLERSEVPHVVYSSCNAESLARDLAAMPSLRPVRGVLLDMFAHTEHHEVLVQLDR